MIRFTILGQPQSKANSRELATIGPKDARRTILRKSTEALAYERDALRQVPPRHRVRLTGPVRVTLRIWYASERPDLDESLVLDVLQDRWGKKGSDGNRPLLQAGVYRNDRQVREKHVYHGIDAHNPRAEIEVEPMQAQQTGLDLDPQPADPFAVEERTPIEALATACVAATGSPVLLDTWDEPFPRRAA